MLNRYNFDVITISKTKLKNNKHLLEHLKVPGYELNYCNRDETRCKSWLLYTKANIE